VDGTTATVIAKGMVGEEKGGEEMEESKEFIVSVSGVNTANGIFNIVALFIILKARSGAMQAVHTMVGAGLTEWAPVWDVPVLMSLMLVSVVIASTLALFLTLRLGRLFAKAYSKIDYRKMTWTIVIFLIVLLFLFTGPMGLALAAVSTVVGMLPPLLGVQRVHLMGCLVLPIILFFSGLDVALSSLLGLI